MSELTIQAICGFGVGSSTLLKIKIQGVLKEMGIEATVFTGDISSASGAACDVIFTSSDLAENLQGRVHVPIVIIKSFVNQKEIKEKLQVFLENR